LEAILTRFWLDQHYLRRRKKHLLDLLSR